MMENSAVYSDKSASSRLGGTFNATGSGGDSLPHQASLDRSQMTATLRAKMEDGFRSSAYWGNNADVPPREADDAVARDTFRFTPEINKKLVPFPDIKGAVGSSLYVPYAGYHLTTGAGGGANASPNSATGLRSTSGGLEGDGPMKPRFLNLTTSQQRAQGVLGDEAKRALADGLANERRLMDERDALRKKPFNSLDPLRYRLTSQDHCDYSPVDPSSYRVGELNPDGDLDGSGEGGLDVYRSRYNLVTREGPKHRTKTHEQLDRSKRVNRSELQAQLQSTLNTMLPTTYNPEPGKAWMTTNQFFHAPYDPPVAAEANDRYATIPVQNRNQTVSSTFAAEVTARSERGLATRQTGQWATEYHSNFRDGSGASEVDPSFRNRTIFDIRYGVPTMAQHAHHPREDVNTGEEYGPSQLVPGQYVTMSQRALHARDD